MTRALGSASRTAPDVLSQAVAIERSTVWPYDAAGEPGQFYYSRYDHPNGVAAEQELGALEGGDALLYASGMGATTTVLLAFARSGATIALAEGAYFGTSKLIGLLEPFGLRLVEFDQEGEPPEADIVWVESPANPTLTRPNWDALREHPAWSSATRRSRRPSTCARSTRAPTSSSTRRRSS